MQCGDIYEKQFIFTFIPAFILNVLKTNVVFIYISYIPVTTYDKLDYKNASGLAMRYSAYSAHSVVS